jgi:2-polyprenyl-3-methyl-5-hydroxy-6-metoxy-1,4-benzoquinol methylase
VNENEKTELTHWESAWAARPRLRFPTGLDIGTMNVLRLLKRYLRPGIRYIEVGCAPGKILSWVGREIGVPVCGIDYSPTGAEMARWLCGGLGIKADIRCEDAMLTTFAPAEFDLVFSCGLIEHFEDPSEMVAAHLRLVAPGGTALIAIPNYSGLYLRLQRWCNPSNLDIHNLSIMNERTIVGVAQPTQDFYVRAFRSGRFSPWLISLPMKFGAAGKLASWGLNFFGHLQFLEISGLCPLVVLEARRTVAATHTSEATTHMSLSA